MRILHLTLTLLLFVTACNNARTGLDRSATESSKKFPSVDTSRIVLIQELKKIKQTLATNDKFKIAELFKFPLADTSFSIYTEDSSFSAQFTSHGNQTTKEMFINHFNSVSPAIQIDRVNELFKNIRIDSLAYKDTLTHEAYSTSEPCYYSYRIEVDNDDVALRIDMRSNTKYKSNNKSQEDTAENDSEVCEHNFWWTFNFNGHRLALKQISGAD